MTTTTARAFAVWNGDEDGWNAIDESCVLHDGNRNEPIVGRDAIRANVAEYRSAMPELHVEAGESITVGDLVVHAWTATASGGISIEGVSVGRLRADLLVESWVVTAI